MATVLDKFDPEKHFFKDPYPHVIIEDALPQDLYNQLANEFPVQHIKEHQPLLEGHTHRYLAYDVLHLKKFHIRIVAAPQYKPHQTKKVSNFNISRGLYSEKYSIYTPSFRVISNL